MMQKLGACINGDNPDTRILRELDCPPIEVLFDMIHNIKNVRNSWGSIKILKNWEGKIIDWNYIVKLHELQCVERLRAANKLTNKHVYYENYKMKAIYAIQVFSRSVGRSLKFLREVDKREEFQGSEATEEFLYIMNDIFDAMNSRSSKGYKYQAPLRECNKDDWLQLFVKTHIYIYELRNGVTGDRMCTDDPKKTGFLGIICNIVAVERIFRQHVENGPLFFLLTYKLCQDFLEHFFGLGKP